jgi:hypothetical protein
MSIQAFQEGIKLALKSGWQPKTTKTEAAVRIALETVTQNSENKIIIGEENEKTHDNQGTRIQG